MTYHSPGNYYLTLLRHGESVANANHVYQGQSDFPLSDLGRQQAHKLAERWQFDNTTFDQIISSPLSRARETAEIIAGKLQLPMQTDPLWVEVDVGLMAGLSAQEVAERYPRTAFIHPYQPIAQTGESRWELFMRAGQAIQRLLKLPAGKYLVVAHGGILNMAMHAILGITPTANFQGAWFHFKNTAFANLIYSSTEHIWHIHKLNDSVHLEANQTNVIG